MANELRATPLSFSCILKRRAFVVNSLFYMMLFPRRFRKIYYAPKTVFHSIQLGFTIRFALVLLVVAILYQRRWPIFWATIARASRAARTARIARVARAARDPHG